MHDPTVPEPKATGSSPSSSDERPLRFRFAPSPTGFFHVGGARTALYNWVLARQLGGAFVLRIEDTDEERNREEWTQGIIDALAWLGISKDDPAFEGPYFQSANRAAQVNAAERLFAEGHAYYCDLSPDQIQARINEQGGKGGYDGYSRDRGLGPGPGRVLRFRVPEGHTIVDDEVRGRVEFDNGVIEDFVLLRSNGSPMFLLANVVDDLDQRVSHVIRAEEHLPNTPKQQMIWQALGEKPPVWAHVPVLVNEQRKKLSKRRDKVALEQFRDEGYTMPAMRNYLMTLGWMPPDDQEIVPFEFIQQVFSLHDVNKSPAFFDLKKLAAFNSHYLRMMSPDDLIRAAQPWIDKWLEAHPGIEFSAGVVHAMAPHIQQRVITLADLPGTIDFLLLDQPEIDEQNWAAVMGAETSAGILREALRSFDALTEWTSEGLKAALEYVGERVGLKLGKAQAPVRVAISGRTVGPPLFESIEQLGRTRSLQRMQSALERLESE